MKARTVTVLYRGIYTDPVDRSAVTVDVYDADGTVHCRVGVGPGVGPHTTTSPAALTHWAYMLTTAARVLEQHTAPSIDATYGVQLTLADA